MTGTLPAPRRRRIVSSMISLYGLQVLTLLIPLILLPILTRALGPDVWGVYAVQLSLGAIMLVFLEFGFGFGGTRGVAAVRSNRPAMSAILVDVLGARALLSLVACAIWVAVWFAVPIVRAEAATYWLTLVLTLVQGFSLAWFFQAIGRLPFAFGWELVARIGSALLIILLVHGPEDVALVPLFQIAALVVTFVITILAARKVVDLRRPSLAGSISMIRSNAHLALLRLMQNFSSLGNTFLIGALAPAYAAFYGSSERASNAVRSLLGPVTQVAFPEMVVLASEDPARARHVIRRALLVVFGVAVLGALVLGLLAEWVVLLLFGPAFEPSVPVLRILFATLPLFAIIQMFGPQWMLTQGHDRPFILIVGGGLVLDIVLAVVLVPHFAAQGMAMAFAAGELVVAVSLVLYVELVGPRSRRIIGPIGT